MQRARLMVLGLGATLMALAASAVPAFADVTTPSVDYSGVESNLVSGIGPAVGAGLVILGIVAGIFIGIRTLKKVSGAKTP